MSNFLDKQKRNEEQLAKYLKDKFNSTPTRRRLLQGIGLGALAGLSLSELRHARAAHIPITDILPTSYDTHRAHVQEYVELENIAAASVAAPAAGRARVFRDIADGILKRKNSDDSIQSIEDISGAPHAMFSATHSDSSPGPPLRGAIMAGNAVFTWARLVIGPSGNYLRSDGTDVSYSAILAGDLPSTVVFNDQNNDLNAFYVDLDDIAVPANPAAGHRRLFVNTATGELSVRTPAGATVSLEGALSSHDLLSATHDALAAARLRGDLMVANATPLWARLALGATGTYLRSNGTDLLYSAILAGDLPSTVVFNDQNNDLNAFYVDIDQIAVPANPAANHRRIFNNSATGELSVRTPAGATVSLEGAGGGTDRMILFGGAHDTAINNGHFSTIGGDDTATGSENTFSTPAPITGVMDRLFAKYEVVGAATEWDVTFRVAGVDSSLAAHCSANNTVGSDTVNTASVTAGDLIVIVHRRTTGANTANICRYSMRFTPS